jgi:hypothetical protein
MQFTVLQRPMEIVQGHDEPDALFQLTEHLLRRVSRRAG